MKSLSPSRGHSVPLEFLPRHEVASADWDALVLASPDGWVWGLHSWQDVVGVFEGIRDCSFAVRQGKQLLAVVPLGFTPASRHMASSGWGLCGPMLRAGLHAEHEGRLLSLIYDHICDQAKSCGATVLQVGFSPVTPRSTDNRWGVNPLCTHGFEDVSGFSRVIDLSVGEARLWDGLSKDCRYMIRRAKLAGYTIDKEAWGDHLDNYYQLHLETYERTGAPPHPRGYFSHIAATLDDTYSQLWVCRDAAGAVAAYINVARFGCGYMYWTGCGGSKHLNAGANYLALWGAIEYAAKTGGRGFDVGQVFPGVKTGKLAGLATFKSKFGGEVRRHLVGNLLIEDASAPATSGVHKEAEVEQAGWPRSLGNSLGVAKRTICRIRGLSQSFKRGLIGGN